MDAEDIVRGRKKLGLSQEKLAKIIGVNKNTIYNYENGSKIPESKIPILVKTLGLNKDDIDFLQVKDFDTNKLKIELKQVSFDDFMEVDYLPAKAQAGYLSSLEDNQHLELETILVPKEYEKGDYTVIEITGASMDDGSNRSICDGDKLLVKELQDNYTSKTLQFRQFLFVIVSREGVVCKQITNHDVEKGLITCHSFNPTYSDYTIDLRDVYRLFYVKKIVERRIKF